MSKSKIGSIIVALLIFILFSFKTITLGCPISYGTTYSCSGNYKVTTTCTDVIGAGNCCTGSCCYIPASGNKYMTCCSSSDYCDYGCSDGSCNTCTDGTYTCTPTCGPSFASSSQGYGSTSLSCTDDCGFTDYGTCYCYQCSVASCPSSYATSSQGHGSLTYDTCTNGCGVGNSRTCYCYQCSVDPCPSKYNVATQGFGSLIYDTCTNDCGEGNSRTCHCYNCLKACPDPLTPTGSANLILESFRECTNDCNVKPAEDQDDCYETESPQPVETFRIIDPTENGITSDPPNGFDFKSLTHTGDNIGSSQESFAKLQDLNDPIYPVIMSATYTDDTASDIEGMFVWFRESHYTGEPGTPVNISTTETPKAPASDSWGFMLRRDGSNWKPYVPAYVGATSYWRSATYTSTPNYLNFYILGPNSNQMIEVTILTKPNETATSVTMNFSLRFSNPSSGNLLTDNVAQGVYKILLMGLDKFSFTPYDNYSIDYDAFWEDNFLLKNYTNFSYYWGENQLRYKAVQGQLYARDWYDSGKTWTIDYQSPTFNLTNGFTKTINGNNLIVSWNVSDERNLYAIVGNIYVSGADQEPLTLSTSTAGITLRDDSLPNSNGYQVNPTIADNSKVGKLVKVDTDSATWSFRVNPNLGGNTHSGSVTINIGNNTVGNLQVYLTVFDDAGNIAQQFVEENLADRFLTAGGLAYSAGDMTFAQLSPTNDTMWTIPNRLPPYSSVSEGMQRRYAGFTSEMWATNYSTDLTNMTQAKSYRLPIHDNREITNTTSLYQSFLKKYELHKKYFLPTELGEITVSTPTLPSVDCGKSYCVYKKVGVLSISNLTCNKKALIFVQGDLTITPPLNSDNATTLSNQNGCLFVVSGTVIINSGFNIAGTFEYEKINAFIVSDGVITINHQSQAIVDGVYINGGLISKGGSKSIVVNRYLRLEERLLYPVISIDLHPKYGILAEDFLGTSYVIQSTEVGINPF